MVDIESYVEDISKYVSSVDSELVEDLAKRYRIVMEGLDSRLVSCSDDEEKARVRENFINEKLGVSDDTAADAAIVKVCEKMSDDRTKNRITFYYLLIEELDAKHEYMSA
jgi:chorismate mutase